MQHRNNRHRASIVAALTIAAAAGSALAGGSAENILLIVNPASAESMYVADYYKNVRNIPDQNVLYIQPSANHMDPSQPGDPPLIPYSTAAGPNADLDAVAGYLANAGIGNHIDYIVVANTGEFFTSAPGYITDGCSPVNRFSQPSLFTTAFLKSTILGGGNPSTLQNHFYSASQSQPPAFSSSTLWFNGAATQSLIGKRYYIGAQLGYTGANGNTLAEILAMIDRAAAADATHPAGVFYYMNNTADPIRNVRACGDQGAGCAGPTPVYTAAVTTLTGLGGAGQVPLGVLPTLHQDCLGVMTGDAFPAIDTENMTLLPGSFCDHLTSWAATFDNGNQVKASSWIRRGAAGSAGTVEEPCAYLGKFPSPNYHIIYFQGLSLGEAYLRSMQYVPFQSLLYGDPMCRPWATLPAVTGNIPSGTVSGSITFTPAATTALPGASIAGVTLLIDGVQQATKTPGQSFTINTVALPEGWHEVRVLAWDNTSIKSTGRWVGSFTSSNYGRSASIAMNTLSGDMTTLFSATAAGAGSAVQELRLLQNGRVAAAASGSPANLQVYGRNLGSGTTHVQVEAVFADGRTARSAPATLNIAYAVGTFSGQPPVAYNFTKKVARGGPFVVELPARFDDALSGATYTIVSPPTHGTTVGAGTRATRVMTTTATACGEDQFTFRVNTASGQSNLATVTLIYGPGPVCPADVFPDGSLNVLDFSQYLNLFAAGDPRADMDGNCTLNVLDFGAYVNAFAVGCP